MNSQLGHSYRPDGFYLIRKVCDHCHELYDALALAPYRGHNLCPACEQVSEWEKSPQPSSCGDSSSSSRQTHSAATTHCRPHETVPHSKGESHGQSRQQPPFTSGEVFQRLASGIRRFLEVPERCGENGVQNRDRDLGRPVRVHRLASSAPACVPEENSGRPATAPRSGLETKGAEASAVRGLLYALLISAPLWAVIVGLLWFLGGK